MATAVARQQGPIVLPKMEYVWTKACSSRRGAESDLVVVHRWAIGRPDLEDIQGIINEFKDPANQASSHGVYSGHNVGKDHDRCVQMVRLRDKAWTCEDFNARSDNWEFGDPMWQGHDPVGLATAARIVASNLKLRDLPAIWVHGEHLHSGQKGFTRHYDLGVSGGGHTDPTTDLHLWEHFCAMVKYEYHRGGFRHDNWLKV